jgi:hypothetical protein
MIDWPTLHALAARSLDRPTLAGLARPYAKSAALFSVGYNVGFWVCLGDMRTILEYLPRHTFASSSLLPRITLDCWADQAALHRALGLAVVSPGDPWNPHLDAHPGLFDHLEDGK